ncbi:hypothetical protein DXG01_013780 [Tephrocybe rancida]|nr:hypothetical protein DXG01_013780 [Tephrocybe rancida]
METGNSILTPGRVLAAEHPPGTQTQAHACHQPVSRAKKRRASVRTTGQVVDLGYASYEGSSITTTGITRFLGIRYAAPPTGPLRWQLPRTPDHVVGIVQANVMPPGCPATLWGSGSTSPSRQGPVPTPIDTTPEDCLFLNGGYSLGSAAQYNGEDLVRGAKHDVVAVVIQYRLGLFGFLAGNEVKAGGVLNAGLRDQEFALQWVQEHIAKFGGDPTQVTIWGQSSGAGSVLQHVIANDGKTMPPLFRAAITSSTYLPSQYLYNDAIPQALYNQVVSQVGCTSAIDTLACLRAVDFAELDATNQDITSRAPPRTFVFFPVVDGTYITQRPSKALSEHKVNGDALLSVTNTFEGVMFVDRGTASTINVPQYIGGLFPTFGEREIEKAAALYAGLGSPIDQAEFALLPAGHGDDLLHFFPTYGMASFFCSTSKIAHRSSLFGRHDDPVDENDDTPNTDVDPDFDKPHFQSFIDLAMNSTSDIVQNQTSAKVQDRKKNEHDFDKAFSRSFLDFATSLDPNVKSDHTITPMWRPWADGQVEMVFNKTVTEEPVVKLVETSSSLLERCKFWDHAGAISGQ